MSNKAAPHRKFAQTFVLAEQPNGYFVLNDIFRYISEDAEEEVDTATVQQPEASNAAAPEQEPKTLTSSEDPVAQNEDAELVDKKLQEEVVQHPDEDAVMEDETTEDEPVPEVQQAEDKSNSIATTESEGGDKMDVPAQDEQVAALAIQDIAAEKPKDPDPTPIASPPKPAKVLPVEDNSAPAAPPKPAAPKTWANLVAANRIASPAAPNTTSSTSPSSQSKAAQPPAVPVPALNTSTNEDSASQPQQSPGAGWQTAGQDSGKRLGRQQSVSGPSEKTTVLGYVKNVTDKVDASLLKATLTQYGRLEYFDVSRPKVCSQSFLSLLYYAHLSRIVHSLNSLMQPDTTLPSLPIHTRLAESRYMLKNVDLVPPLTGEASVAEAAYVAAVEDLKAARPTKDVEAFRKTVVEAVLSLEVEAAILHPGAEACLRLLSPSGSRYPLEFFSTWSRRHDSLVQRFQGHACLINYRTNAHRLEEPDQLSMYPLCLFRECLLPLRKVHTILSIFGNHCLSFIRRFSIAIAVLISGIKTYSISHHLATTYDSSYFLKRTISDVG